MKIARAALVALLAFPLSCANSSGAPEKTDRSAAPTRRAFPLERAYGAVGLSVDPRVELLALVCRLAGFEEYLDFDGGRYAKKVDEAFGRFADHPAVVAMRALRESRGICYNAPISLAIHLDADLRPVVPLSPLPERLDSRWEGVEIDSFLEILRDFRDASGFDDFFLSNMNYFESALDGAYDVLVEDRVVEWLDAWYGVTADQELRLVVSPLVGSKNYGCSVRLPDGRLRLAPVVCVGAPAFIVVHEYSHGYANPLALEAWPRIERRIEELYLPVSKEMEARGNGDAWSLLCETLVRANVAMYERWANGEEAFQRALERERASSFLLVPALCRFMESFVADRSAYPTWGDFFPEIEAWLMKEARY